MSRGALAKQLEPPHRIGEFLAEFAVGDRMSALASPEALTLAIRREVLPALETAFAMAQDEGIAGRFEMIEIDLGDFDDPPDWYALRERFVQRLLLALRAQTPSALSAGSADTAWATPGTAREAWTAQSPSGSDQDHPARHPAGDVLGILRALAALPQDERLAELRRLRAVLPLPPASVPFDVDADWRTVTRQQEAQLVAALITAGLAPKREAEATRIIRLVLDGARGRFVGDGDAISRGVIGQDGANAPGTVVSPRMPERDAPVTARQSGTGPAEGAGIAVPGVAGDRTSADEGKTILASAAKSDRVTGQTGSGVGPFDPDDANAFAALVAPAARAEQPTRKDPPGPDTIGQLPVSGSPLDPKARDMDPSRRAGGVTSSTPAVPDGQAQPRADSGTGEQNLSSPMRRSGSPEDSLQDGTRAPTAMAGSPRSEGGAGADAPMASGPARLGADAGALGTKADPGAVASGMAPGGDGISDQQASRGGDHVPFGDVEPRGDEADTPMAGDPALLGADAGELGAAADPGSVATSREPGDDGASVRQSPRGEDGAGVDAPTAGDPARLGADAGALGTTADPGAMASGLGPEGDGASDRQAPFGEGGVGVDAPRASGPAPLGADAGELGAAADPGTVASGREPGDDGASVRQSPRGEDGAGVDAPTAGDPALLGADAGKLGAAADPGGVVTGLAPEGDGTSDRQAPRGEGGAGVDEAGAPMASGLGPIGADAGKIVVSSPDPDGQARVERDSVARVQGSDTRAKASDARPDADHTLPADRENPAGVEADTQNDQATDAAHAPAAVDPVMGLSEAVGDGTKAAVGKSFEGPDRGQETGQDIVQDGGQDAAPVLRARTLALLDALGPVPADISQAIARLPHGPLTLLHAHLLRAVINLAVPDGPALAEALADFALYEDLSRVVEIRAQDPETLEPALAKLPLVVMRLLAQRLAGLADQTADRAPEQQPQAAQDDTLTSARALSEALADAVARAQPSGRDVQDRAAAQDRGSVVPKRSDAPPMRSAQTGQTAAAKGWLRDVVTKGDATAVDGFFQRDPFGLLSMLEQQSAQDLAALVVVLGGAPRNDALREEVGEPDQRQDEAAPPAQPEVLLARVIARLSERQDGVSGSPRPVRRLGLASESGLGADQASGPPSDAALPPGAAMLVDALRLVWSVLPEGLTAAPGPAAAPGTGMKDDRRAIAGMGDARTAQAEGLGPDTALSEANERRYVALIAKAGRRQEESTAQDPATLAEAIAVVLQNVTQVDDRADVIATLHARWRLAASMGGAAASFAQALLAALYTIIPDLQPDEPGQALPALDRRDRAQSFVEGAYILAVAAAPSDPAQADDMVHALSLRAKDLGLDEAGRIAAMDRLRGRLVQAGDPVPAVTEALAKVQAPTASRENAVSQQGGDAAQVYAQALRALSAPMAETRSLPMVAQLQSAVGDILATLATPEQRKLALRTAYARLRYATTPAQGARQMALSALRGLDPTLRDPSGDDAHGTLTRVAGVVLIGPYLKPLFARAGLLDDENRIAPEQLGRAASLLRAVTGVAGEDLDPLERVLLGVPDGVHIPFVPLSQTQADLVESLLGAVIQQWSALGKTSVGGLRETFLRRDGDLFRDSTGGGRLTVHTGAFDVLLDRLPWSLSPLRAPWMPAPLIVRWRSQDD